jgi:hypothetical protein
MYTTNTVTKELPTTYMDRERESDALARITREMRRMASDNPERFLDDPRFRKLDDAFRTTVLNLASLI